MKKQEIKLTSFGAEEDANGEVMFCAGGRNDVENSVPTFLIGTSSSPLFRGSRPASDKDPVLGLWQAC